MDRVSRPLLGVLLATVIGAALWVTMLKPSNSTSGGPTGTPANPSLGQLSGAIAAAHGAVATSNAASVRHGGSIPAGSPGVPKTQAGAGRPATGGAPGTPASATPAIKLLTHKATVTHRTAAHPRTVTRSRVHRAVVHRAAPLTPAARLRAVSMALEHHQVLAMLFYNPSGADDRMVRRELATVPAHRGAVVKLAVPLAELASYSLITQQVPVTGSPTLVIVDRGRGATEIVGFADKFEIAQRIDDALAVSP